ncbi:XRE family transcriptional regulator [Nocardia yunnanensis]|uniref:XRE family transcriptional regulator n=1 Tax=Nocardia yunnanensis TaxID=2382165 RepID=A0A386ZE31_9NOCA|nr:helix-turn-helix transcriptional regulator [Nocardia yunnanensis]AYF75786.1 XRE family transcriptional regulator [Nocardia yunnanensis]
MSGSTLAGRALGRLLAEYRQRANLSRSAAARIAATSIQTMGRLEDGLKAKVSHLWINALADAYRCSDEERQLLLNLAQEMNSAQKNWWRAYADEMNPGLHHYLALEGAARKLTTWRVSMIPGLLQTPEYRRAIAWYEYPEMPPAQVEKRIEMHIRRQKRLDDAGFVMDVIVSELVLRDQIGGPAVMAEQLQRLVDLSVLDRISIRAVTYDAPGHLGSMVGSFALLEFPKLPATGMVEPPVVFVEGYAGDLYLEREGEVRRYRNAFAEIARVALDPDTTRQLMLSIAKEFRA